MRAPLALLLVPLLAGCPDRTVASVPVVQGAVDVKDIPAVPRRDVDILFLIDDSLSMVEEQESLKANFGRFITVLESIQGGLPNIHIGVATPNLGTTAIDGTKAPSVGTCVNAGEGGKLRRTASGAAFLSDIDNGAGGRTRNYTGTLSDAFKQLATVGSAGCGIEQHLEAVKRALDGNPENAGFLRPNAYLAVIIVADEDDCSLSSSALLGPDSAQLGPIQSFRCFRFGVECDQDTDTVGTKSGCIAATASPYVEDLNPFVDALLAAKSDARMLMTAAIVGTPSPVAVQLAPPPGGGVAQPALQHSCSIDTPDGPDVADPGIRIAEFLDAFPGRNALTSICSADLSNPLQMIGQSAARMMGGACLDSSTLADASTEAGVQPSCEVADIRDSAPDAAMLLPLCSSGAPDCYEIIADPAACPASSDHLRVRIHRVTTAAEDSWTYVRCQLSS